MNREGRTPSLFTFLIGLGDRLMSMCACVFVCVQEGAVGDPQAQWDSPGAHSAAVGFPRSHNDAGRATCKSSKWHNCQRSQVWMEAASPACGPSWACGWPLNTPANFSSLVHVATGGATGASSAVGSPNCPVKGWGGGWLLSVLAKKHGTIRLKHKNWQAVQKRATGLCEWTQPPTNTQSHILHYDIKWLLMFNGQYDLDWSSKTYKLSNLRVDETKNVSDKNHSWDYWLWKKIIQKNRYTVCICLIILPIHYWCLVSEVHNKHDALAWLKNESKFSPKTLDCLMFIMTWLCMYSTYSILLNVSAKKLKRPWNKRT